jgi:hypothetical protein
MSFLRKVKKTSLCLTLAFAAVTAGDAGVRQWTNEFTPLSKSDRDRAEQIFGDRIDYDKVRLSQNRVSFLQNQNQAVTLGNTIYFGKDVHNSRPLRMHELIHVDQNQNDVPHTGVLGAFRLWMIFPSYKADKPDSPYAYAIDTTKSLSDYNMEQQGKMISDYDLACQSVLNDPLLTITFTQSAKKQIPDLEKIISRTLPLKPFAEIDTARGMRAHPLP